MVNMLRVFRRHLVSFRQTWHFSIIYNVLDPLINLAAMGFGLGVFVQDIQGLTYSQFLAPGMIASSAMFSATFECSYGSFVRMHFQKIFHAMLATTLTVKDIVFGEILYGIFNAIIFGSIVLTIGNFGIGVSKLSMGVNNSGIFSFTGKYFCKFGADLYMNNKKN